MNPDLCHRIVFPTELNSLCIYYTHQLLLLYNMSIWAEYSRRILVCWLKIMKVWCDGWGPTLPIQAIKTQNTNHLGLQKLGFFWRTLRFWENIVCIVLFIYLKLYKKFKRERFPLGFNSCPSCSFLGCPLPLSIPITNISYPPFLSFCWVLLLLL